MNEVSLQGRVEKVEGKLPLQIPLAVGGGDLIGVTRGIARVDGDILVVTIPEWLAASLRIEHGSDVVVDNLDGKFNIRPVKALPLQ
jgi:hypothetical protein